MPQFFPVTEPVVCERHHALPTKEMATAFWAFPWCLQVLGRTKSPGCSE
jgi:hypothetical protein